MDDEKQMIETVTVTLASRLICALHDLAELDLDPAEQAMEIVISGHSHRPKAETVDGVLYLNPGSAHRPPPLGM